MAGLGANSVKGTVFKLNVNMDPIDNNHMEVVVEKRKKPEKPDRPPRDTIEVDDMARVPIGWNPSIEDWEETNL